MKRKTKKEFKRFTPILDMIEVSLNLKHLQINLFIRMLLGNQFSSLKQVFNEV